MKRVQEDLRYDGATVEQVYEMLGTQKFRESVCDYQRVLRHDVTVNQVGETMSVSIDQDHATDRLPGFAKKFVGESTRAITTQVWQGRAATVEVETPGKPTSIAGSATLAENGTGSTLTYDLDVKASVPLVGGKLEKLVVELTTEGFDKEQAVGAAWLAGERA